jgi:hypothetical protein
MIVCVRQIILHVQSAEWEEPGMSVVAMHSDNTHFEYLLYYLLDSRGSDSARVLCPDAGGVLQVHRSSAYVRMGEGFPRVSVHAQSGLPSALFCRLLSTLQARNPNYYLKPIMVKRFVKLFPSECA